jgi:hypothetical protein
LRNICLIGTEPIDLAGHIAVARPRGEAVKAQRGRRGYRCAAGALFGDQEESLRADREILPNPSHSRSGVGRFWIHRVLLSEGIESHVVDAASIATSRRRRRPRPTGSTARLCFAHWSPTSAANRGSVRWFGRQHLKIKTAAELHPFWTSPRKPSVTEAFRTSYESPVRSPSCNPQGHGPRRVRSVDGIEPDRRGRN